MNRFLLSFVFLALVLFSATACADYDEVRPTASHYFTPYTTLTPVTPTTSQQSVSQRPEGKFLFVEVWLKIEGVGKVPGARIDKPTYSFDTQSKELFLRFNKKETSLSPSDWGFVGQGTSLHGTAGGGIASGVTVMQQLPINMEVAVPTGNVTNRDTAEFTTMTIELYSISIDGTIFLKIGEESIVLDPDESWIVTKEILFSSDKYNGKMIIASSITNYGWLSIDSINP